MILAPGLGQVSTLAVRHGDLFASVLGFEAAGHTSVVRPNPPMRTFSGEDLEWSAGFTGPSSGQYAAEVLGRRTMRVGSDRVKTLGLRVRLAIAGKVTGSEVSTRWVVLRSNLVAAETVVRRQTVDDDVLTLRYTSKLRSVHPEPR